MGTTDGSTAGSDRVTDSPSAPRIGFLLEQTLGHITHADNLRHLVPGPDIDAVFVPIEYDETEDGLVSRLPGMQNWTVRAGRQARRAIRRLRRDEGIDALFIHTQVPATLVPDLLRKVPSVVSLDATPRQYDELGAFYDHRTAHRWIEAVKRSVHVRCFASATRLVTWSTWSKQALVDDYGVPAAKIDVIPPGVDTSRWSAVGSGAAGASDQRHSDGVTCRVLFVGGDLERKGGAVLIAAVKQLRERGLDIEVDLVTTSAVAPEAGVRVHANLRPNDPELIALYQRADVFCLPTFADCLPMVLSEAGAVGLPLVSTAVGAIGEIAVDNETGLLVPPGDVAALAAALERLAVDVDLRRQLGETARTTVIERFDAATNARRLVELLRDVATAR